MGAVITSRHYLHTGQRTCHADDGREVPCEGSGQDASFAVGTPRPEPRFDLRGDEVIDRLTGLTWCRSANLAEFPLTWQEALDFVAAMNREQRFGRRDWRMPNRRELRSLLSLQTRLPALPERHPFIDVFNGWYWTATTAAISPAHAWYVALELVVYHQPVRARLGVGPVPGKRRDGGRTKAVRTIFGMGRGNFRLTPARHFIRMRTTVAATTKITTSIIPDPPHPPM